MVYWFVTNRHPSSLTFIECGWCVRAFFSWTLKMLVLTPSSACWCHVLCSHCTSLLKRYVCGEDTTCLVCICVQGYVVWCMLHTLSSLVTNLFITCGEPGILISSCEHEKCVIRKWWKIPKQTFYVVFKRQHAQCLVHVYDSHLLASWIRVVYSYLVSWLFFTVLDPVHSRTIKPFLSILLSLMWEKLPGPLLLFHTASDRKLGGVWEWGYTLSSQ